MIIVEMLGEGNKPGRRDPLLFVSHEYTKVLPYPDYSHGFCTAGQII